MAHLFKKSLAAATLLASLSAASMADAAYSGYLGSDTLKSWSVAAGEDLQDAMAKPLGARASNAAGTLTYHVRLDADGMVKSYDRISLKGDRRLGSLSNRLVRNLELPDLPESYSELTVKVVLNYNGSHSTLPAPTGSVSTQRLSSGRSQIASLQVVGSVAR